MQQEDVTRMLEEMDMQAGGLIDLPIVERQRSGRIRGPQDVVKKPSPIEEENKMLKETIEQLTAPKTEVQSQETEQETIMPKDDTGDEDANKVMTLQDDRVLGTFPLQAREKKLEALDKLQTLTGEELRFANN